MKKPRPFAHRADMSSSNSPALRIEWATHAAAKFACENWHYSRCMPKSKLAKLGVWEDGKFIGVVIYGVGATSDLVKKYGLTPQEGCELVRVALTKHKAPVSRILSISLRLLKKCFCRVAACRVFCRSRGRTSRRYLSGWRVDFLWQHTSKR